MFSCEIAYRSPARRLAAAGCLRVWESGSRRPPTSLPRAVGPCVAAQNMLGGSPRTKPPVLPGGNFDHFVVFQLDAGLLLRRSEGQHRSQQVA
jgi:hypothetical protein